MIKRVKKVCKICKHPEYIWSRGCCKACWHKAHGKPIKRSEHWVKKQSELGKARTVEYKRARSLYFVDHPICERCGSKEHLDLHHKRGRDGQNLYKDFMTVCRTCHQWIHDNVLESYKLGYLLSRLSEQKE